VVSDHARRDEAPPYLLGVGLVALLGLGAYGLFGLLSAGGDVVQVRGVRLGLTPTQVRERFDPGIAGDWRSTTVGEDLHLTWTPGAEGGDLRQARFEFHLGLLVALRLALLEGAPEALGAPLEVRAASVRTVGRSADGGGADLVWLARGCPTHREEVERLLSASP
jgi:hypothetical protein